ncbi:hypothetical protein [Bacillus suaedaesalsae]|uniref:Uncharacterized protein n=1 Tax=Bacillus suaedaesalsae TaxID=2810349 RepID=A0ABS2DFI4_9BACI|nr:hypothetical protein [Bacillus suaedaesalsae]MBM6616333.1 hypothetical protein [Bacillus suaedaesalsae]
MRVRFFFYFIASNKFTLLTVSVTGKTFNSQRELDYARSLSREVDGGHINLGLPIPYIKQSIQNIDPPLPYKFGFDFESVFSFNIFIYLLNVMIILFVVFLVPKSIAKALNGQR